jgi:peptide/nickel transport system substrate-binding protein
MRASKTTFRVRLALVAAACALVAAGCGGGSGGGNSTAGHGGTPEQGGTATFALPVGEDFTWLFPIENTVGDEPWDINVEESLWRPLYFAGQGEQPVIDNQLSIANPPVYSDNDRTVTVTLKPWRWSDGTPVTSRDVEFFMNLEKYNKAQDAWYVQGEMPDNISSIDYPNASTIVFHLNTTYSEQWFTNNQLTWIYPLPQHMWDKTSLTGTVGDYDRTAAGAKSVFNFLYGQSSKVSTYQSNPLWQTVDGPWKLTGYDATTFQTTLSPNAAYTGPGKPYLSKFVIESYPSETAEVDALRAGEVTYGYLPFSDFGLTGVLQRTGYTLAPWAPEYVQWAELGYTSKTYGPLVKQLYIRQALQHLINQPLYMNQLFHNDGQYTYGPVPNLPGSPYVSPQEKIDPDPYSVAAARSLLTSHGWAPGAGGIMTCQQPGTGANQCGAGIAAGRQLSFKMMYSTGEESTNTEVETYQTAAQQAGIAINLDPQTEQTMFSIGGTCPPGPCDWGILIYSAWMWNYGQGSVYPTVESAFETGNYWGGGYSDPTADKLIQQAFQSTGIQYLYDEENYLSQQVAALWFPTVDNAISVVSNKLSGWQPQQVFANPMPENWYFTK